MLRIWSFVLTVVLGMAGLVLTPGTAEAIPAFARKYKLGCNTCHIVYPQLNRFGRDFRDNGFRMPDEIEPLLKRKNAPAAPAPPAPVASHAPPDASAPADDDEATFWSFIPEQIPLSIQAKLHDVINPKGDVKTDFQLEELQLQAGGTMTPRISYYLHHHLVEEGQPGDLYTGWVRFNNLAHSSWNVTVGQFELPLSFSPEIERVSSFDYLVFGQQLGTNAFDLNTPQLGVQVFGQTDGGTKFWAGVVNGDGLAINDATGTNDSNSFKDVYARVTQEFGEHFVGGFAYYGRARGSTDEAGTFSDNFIRVGADAFVNLRKVIVFGTAVYARDDNPLGTGERRSFTGGFAEGDVFLNYHTILTTRFDVVHQKEPAFLTAVEEGAATADIAADEIPFRVNTIAFTPGIQCLVRPNVKLGFEYQVRQERGEDRGIAQLHISF